MLEESTHLTIEKRGTARIVTILLRTGEDSHYLARQHAAHRDTHRNDASTGELYKGCNTSIDARALFMVQISKISSPSQDKT